MLITEMVVAMTCYFVAFSDYPSYQLWARFGYCSHSWKTEVPAVVIKRIENVAENIAEGHSMKTIHAEELPWSSCSPSLSKLADVPHAQVRDLRCMVQLVRFHKSCAALAYDSVTNARPIRSKNGFTN